MSKVWPVTGCSRGLGRALAEAVLDAGDRLVATARSTTDLAFLPKSDRLRTMKSGQTHMHRYMEPLLQKIVNGEIDPSFVITHRIKLSDAPNAYATFRDKKDGCIKVVITP